MGEAKKRGTLEQRVIQAKIRGKDPFRKGERLSRSETRRIVMEAMWKTNPDLMAAIVPAIVSSDNTERHPSVDHVAVNGPTISR